MHSTSKLDDGYLGSGKRLRRSVRKHGESNHVREILEMFETREALIDGEILLITEDLLNDPMCMNLMKGGKGGKISDDQQRRRAIAGSTAFSNRLKTDIAFRERFSRISSTRIKKMHAEGRVKSPDWTGKSHTPTTKQKMSDSKKITSKGERNSQFGKSWIFNDFEKKSTRILKEEVSQYLENGWKLGRKIKW